MNFDFDTLTHTEKKDLVDMLFTPLESPEAIRDWARSFLDFELPFETTDPDSTSNPLDAIWQIYKTVKDNAGNKNPGFILLSCREGLKTVDAAVIETLLFLQFELEIAHAAATEEQSSVGIQYIDSFMFKLAPILAYAGWKNQTKNKRTIKYKTPKGNSPFIKIVICTPKGMNSLHANIMFLDELDLADSKALKEGANIVGYSRGRHGIKVYLSTRKYAFGNMAKYIEEADDKGYKLLKWNIIDVAERCPAERHLPELPTEDRYVGVNLPLIQISKEEFDLLPQPEKHKWELVKDAYAGCKSCLLLPVCKKRLSKKASDAVHGFYKPIEAVIQKFKENDADIAESQLMCWKPGSTGLVYPRFQTAVGKGNVITLKDAFETLIGPTTRNDISEATILHVMQTLGIQFYAGVDWGYTHDFVILIVAILPTGEVWLFDLFASPGLEFVDQLEIAKTYRDKYNIAKWFVDQAMPSNMKSFNKNGMKCPKFQKDVLGGIEAMRSKICTAAGKRLFKVVLTPNTKKAVTAIAKHRFLLDGQGEPTVTPDDSRGIADICDTARYIAQNLWPVKGTYKISSSWTQTKAETEKDQENPTPNQQMMEEIRNRAGDSAVVEIKGGKKGSFYFSF
jgi:hypothetical protein